MCLWIYDIRALDLIDVLENPADVYICLRMYYIHIYVYIYISGDPHINIYIYT
jgi:hypothetical protein